MADGKVRSSPGRDNVFAADAQLVPGMQKILAKGAPVPKMPPVSASGPKAASGVPSKKPAESGGTKKK